MLWKACHLPSIFSNTTLTEQLSLNVEGKLLLQETTVEGMARLQSIFYNNSIVESRSDKFSNALK